MHYFKLIGNPDSFKELWENREALEKYLKRLKELMEEDEKPKDNVTFDTQLSRCNKQLKK